MKKSTHRGFRGPNNFLLARPIFSSRNRTSFFDAESTDAEASIDRGARKSSKTVEKNHSVRYVAFSTPDPCRCLDRSRCSKTIEKIIPFAICSPNEIDASRFSGPERFFACAPYIFFKNRTLFFRRRTDPCRCLDRSRCSKTVENRTIAIVFPHCLQSPGHSPLWSSSLATAHPLAFHRLRIAPTKSDFIAGA